MIEFFMTHLSSFLTVGISVLCATLLKTVAQHCAEKGKTSEEPTNRLP